MAKYDPVTGSRILWEPTSPFAIRVWRGPELDLAKVLCSLTTTLTMLSVPVARLIGFNWIAPAIVTAGREVPYIVALLVVYLVAQGVIMTGALATATLVALATDSR